MPVYQILLFVCDACGDTISKSTRTFVLNDNSASLPEDEQGNSTWQIYRDDPEKVICKECAEKK